MHQPSPTHLEEYAVMLRSLGYTVTPPQTPEAARLAEARRVLRALGYRVTPPRPTWK